MVLPHFHSFLTNVESCASYNDLNDDDKLAHVKLRLVGTASHVLRSVIEDGEI